MSGWPKAAANCLASGKAGKKEQAMKTVLIRQVGKAPGLDGDLSHPAWKQAQ